VGKSQEVKAKEVGEALPEEKKNKRKKRLEKQLKELESFQKELEQLEDEDARLNMTDRDATVMRRKDGTIDKWPILVQDNSCKRPDTGSFLPVKRCRGRLTILAREYYSFRAWLLHSLNFLFKESTKC